MAKNLNNEQMKILKHLIYFKNTKSIALEMGISVATINKKLDLIARKLELNNRDELIFIVDLVFYGGEL